MNINDGLDKVLTKQNIWVYTDGSATTHGSRTGAYAAIIIFPDGSRQHVTGTCNWTTISRMELSAVTAALHYIRQFHLRGICLGQSVQIVSDSEYVVKCATGAKRKENKDLWAQFDELVVNLEVSIEHFSRNEEPDQAMADAMCHHLRVLLVDFLTELESSPDFKTNSFGRTSKFGEPAKIGSVAAATAEEVPGQSS